MTTVTFQNEWRRIMQHEINKPIIDSLSSKNMWEFNDFFIYLRLLVLALPSWLMFHPQIRNWLGVFALEHVLLWLELPSWHHTSSSSSSSSSFCSFKTLTSNPAETRRILFIKYIFLLFIQSLSALSTWRQKKNNSKTCKNVLRFEAREIFASLQHSTPQPRIAANRLDFRSTHIFSDCSPRLTEISSFLHELKRKVC